MSKEMTAMSRTGGGHTGAGGSSALDMAAWRGTIDLGREPGVGWWLPLARGEWRELLARICLALGFENASLECVLTDDAGMEPLHGEHMGRPGPTNVLSFPALGADDLVASCASLAAGETVFLGSIVLSLETLRREAWLYGQDPERHAARLLTHAVLHLAGYEHGPEMEAAAEACLRELEA